MKNNSTEIFKNAPVPKAVLFNVIPSIISMLMVLVYNLADTFFIGQTNNPYMVAAVSLGTPLFLMFMAIGMLFGVGGTSLISRLLGQGEGEKAKHVSSFCFWTGIVIGILGMVFIFIFINPLCNLVGASSDTFSYTKDYLEIVGIGIPFLIISNAFSNIVRSEGHANKAMVGMILGNVTNIILDPVMILWFGWGIRGAAIATTLGNIVACVFYLCHLMSKESILSINIKDYMISNGIATGVLSIGIPASLNSILMSTSNIIANNYMTAHGDMAVAGLGVSMKVNMIVVMLLIGLATGIQPLLGYCFGAGDEKRFKEAFKFSLILSICLSIVMTALCYIGCDFLVRSFLDNEEAFSYGSTFVRILASSGPVLGIMFIFINTLQAIGAGGSSLLLSVCRQGVLYIPILTIINYTIGTAQALTAAQPIADVLSTVLAFILYLHAVKKLFKAKKEQTEQASQLQ